jgi:cell shape-determining protein MreC
MHTADGENYYDYVLRSCKPKNQLQNQLYFLEKRVEELEKENADLRRRCGIKKRVYNPHLGTMCEE